MPENKKYINIGIVAHVDAGKTSITELFLYKSGVTRSIGSVDKGTSQTDWLQVERDRGISVRAASTSFNWNENNINLIDTPGHVDFSAEVERSLRAMDCAILVLSAVEGVQAHTYTLWEALRFLNIPTIFFINKIDRAGADIDGITNEIKKELTADIISLQTVNNEGSNDAELYDILNSNPLSEDTIESIVNNDEALMLRYLNEDKIELQELKESLIHQIHGKKLFPVLCGSAKLDIGITELLDAITHYMPPALGDISKPLSGIVYKVEHDKSIGRVAGIRLFNGVIKNRDVIINSSQNTKGKVSQIRKFIGQKFEDIGVVYAGDTAAICGLDCVKAGDVIGSMSDIPKKADLATALLTVKVSPINNEDYAELVVAMTQLSVEDPSINLIWLKNERELHIKIMGLIQLEILETILLERFNIKVNFGSPSVIYKETPVGEGEGFEEYTMPKPCWAVLRFKIEPGELGSGVVYSSQVGVNDIATKYLNEIERAIPLALKQGILGWEVTDIRITLIGDEDHNIHSRPGDFKVATPMAIMNGLKAIGTKLLEPILEFTITAPEHTLGKIASGLSILRAEFGNPSISNGNFTLSGVIPVSTSLDYSSKLSSITGGKGRFVTKFNGYRECPLEYANTIPFRGISPLDRAKYILQARKAL